MPAKKYTHSEFLDEVYLKNEHYRNGEFEIVGEYKRLEAQILCKDKYGLTKLNCKAILNGRKPSILSALNQTEYWINKAIEVHGDRYDYNLVEYKGSKTQVEIICKEHGLFYTHPDNHLKGHNCSRCRDDKLRKDRSSNTTDFIKKARLKFPNSNLDYSKVKYITNYIPVSITCSIHGEFKQRPSNHLTAKKGCPWCSGYVDGFNFNNWNEMCPGNPGTFYVLKCASKDEEFIKIGITCNTIESRYRVSTSMPYEYKILIKIEDFNRKFIWELEQDLKRELKLYKHKPKIFFRGSRTECFSLDTVKLIIQKINDTTKEI